MKKMFFALLAMAVCFGSTAWAGENISLLLDEPAQLFVPSSFTIEEVPSGCSHWKEYSHGTMGTESNPDMRKKVTSWQKAEKDHGRYGEGVYRLAPQNGVCKIQLKTRFSFGNAFHGSEFDLNDVTLLMRSGQKAEDLVPAGFDKNANMRLYGSANGQSLVEVGNQEPHLIGIFIPDEVGFIHRYLPREKFKGEYLYALYPYIFVFNN